MNRWRKAGLRRGPAVVWRHEVGEGYAGPAVADGKVIVFHRVKSVQIAEALDAKTGKAIWKTELPASYQGGGIDSDRGSKCVPLVHRDKIYLLGPAGNLFCLTLADGKEIWRRNLAEDFSSPAGFFGFGSTPIVIDEKLLLNVGGDDAGIVAFDLNTGKTIWQAVDDRASYSSPIEIRLGDRTLAVFITRLNLIGLNPADGKVLFTMPFGKRGATVNGANPVFVDDHLFVTSAYNVGARWIELNNEPAGVKTSVTWSNDESFSSQYSTPVFADGFFYGTCGREDFGNGEFRCLNAETGKVQWSEKMPVGHTILAGENMLVLDCTGELHLVQVNSQKFDRLATAKVFKTKSRSLPALADGLLYIRSNGPQGELLCLECRKR